MHKDEGTRRTGRSWLYGDDGKVFPIGEARQE